MHLAAQLLHVCVWPGSCTCTIPTVPTEEHDKAKNTSVPGIYPDNAGSKDFAHEKHSRAPEGTARGAAMGGVIGAALAYVASIQAGPITGLGAPVTDAAVHEVRN